MQLFLHLSRSGIQAASIGRLDLDSTEHHPMPSGEVGTASFADPQADMVEFVLGPEAAEIVNETDDATKSHANIVPGKGCDLAVLAHSLNCPPLC